MEWPLADKMCVDRPVCLRGGGLGRARESRRRCRRRRRLRQVSRGRGRAGAEKAGAARDNGERPLGCVGEGQVARRVLPQTAGGRGAAGGAGSAATDADTDADAPGRQRWMPPGGCQNADTMEGGWGWCEQELLVGVGGV